MVKHRNKRFSGDRHDFQHESHLSGSSCEERNIYGIAFSKDLRMASSSTREVYLLSVE